MPKASEVAAILRRLAESIEAQPDIEFPKLYAYLHAESKEQFVAAAKAMPRPFTKYLENEGKKYEELRLKNQSDAMTIVLSVPRNSVCTLLEEAKPAVYRCEPILSLEEEDSLGVSA